MDERVKEGYRRIYSELFSLVIILCAISLVLKVSFLEQNLKDCLLEYVILVGSPIYVLIRSRMLDITSFGAANERKSFKRVLLVCVLVAVLFVGISFYRNGTLNWGEILGFLIPYIICFIAVRYLFIHSEKKRQEKLDSKWEE